LERGLRDATFLSEWLEAGEVAPIDSDFRRAAVGGILTKALLTGLIEPVWIEDEAPIHLLDKQRWISLILDRIDGDFLSPGLGAMLRTTEAGAAVLAISYGTGDLVDAVAIDPRAVIASIGDSTISQIAFQGMPFGHMSIELDGKVAVQIYSQITLHSADGSSGRLETDNPDDATRLLAAMYLQKAHLSLGPEGEFSVQITNGAHLSVARSTEGTAWEIIWINGTSVVCDEGGHIRMEPGNPLKLRSAH
ncbi:MAG TPA: DUF6188 family protein, partial [Thermomicrobiales bacterium]|nr:DUF6188 family protein [Thermomicrobiales bacterium]